MNAAMKQYELVVLLHPDLEIDVDAPIAKIEKLVEVAGGKVVKRDNWGKKRLAYRVRGHDFAVYLAFEFQADPTKTRQLGNSIMLTEEVIRHLLVSRTEAPVHQSKPKAAKATKPVEVDETSKEEDK